jgi:hypothetical protein
MIDPDEDTCDGSSVFTKCAIWKNRAEAAERALSQIAGCAPVKRDGSTGWGDIVALYDALNWARNTARATLGLRSGVFRTPEAGA